MTKTSVRLDVDGSRATITFETDGGLNVLSTTLLHTVGALVARVRREPGVRTTIFQAEGEVFLAGTNVKQVAAYSAEQASEYATLGHGVMADIASLPSITVACIQGAALGSGLELALACDFRLAVKRAKLGFPEVSLGLIPGWGGIGRLTKLVGTSRAKRLILSAVPMSAEEGLAWGLVDEAVNSLEDLRTRTPTFCDSFYRASPFAVNVAKRTSRDFDDVGALEECFAGRDAREGMAAFVEKRPARWME